MLERYVLKCTGLTPLIMDADNVEWADEMERWKEWASSDAGRKAGAVTKAGDDRTPPFRWLGALWHDGERICVPSDAIVKSMTVAGAKVQAPKARTANATFKQAMASGIVVDDAFSSLLVGGKEIPLAPLMKLRDEPDFEKHREAARAAGFTLFVKRASVRMTKHVRVRPRFMPWGFNATVTVIEPRITLPVLEQVGAIMGALGLGNWRPSAKMSPGPFGRFEVVVQKAK